MGCRDVVKKYGIKYFYDITDRSDFRANPDYKGVCHVALAQEGHCKPGEMPAAWSVCMPHIPARDCCHEDAQEFIDIGQQSTVAWPYSTIARAL